MNSALYVGRVRHRRLSPKHEFRYRMFQVYLDLSELEQVFRGRWLWSTNRPNIAWFRRADHLGDPSTPLDHAVRNLVEQRTGRRPPGPIRLLTHLRYFGYVMNPVSFYYCFDEADERVESIVAEINNTPWGEQHCYVLSRLHSATNDLFERHLYRFPKDFHVSPFMSMDQTYEWRFNEPAGTLAVHMDNLERHGKVFDATLTMQRREISGLELAKTLTLYPVMTLQVIAGIYWQALRLRLKGASFYPHPKHANEGVEEAERA